VTLLGSSSFLHRSQIERQSQGHGGGEAWPAI
jgi:hypothetical protein